VVGGRDFVTEHLQLQESFAQEHLAILGKRVARAQSLVEAGSLEAGSSGDLTLAVEQALYALGMFQDRMALRQRFLRNEISAEEAEMELQRQEAQRRLDVQTEAYENAQLHLQRTEDLVARGLASRAELARARIQFIQLELELEVIQRTLEALGSGTTRRY
jgi:multidrug resistance efflux pump